MTTTSRCRTRYNRSFVMAVAILLLGAMGLLIFTTEQAVPAVAAQPPENVAAPLVSPTPCEGNYSWQQVPSPHVGTEHNYLRGVGVVATDNVWAVGFTDPTQRTLIQHWNGTQWTVVPSPNVGPSSNKLYAVTVSAANDIWAVGSYYDTSIFLTRPLTLHYDGSAWAVVAVNIGFGADSGELLGVAAASANEVIAVGRRTGNVQSTLTLHWDGTQWREELSGRIPGCPGSPYTCSFYGVTAVGPNNAWAVGAIHDNGPMTLTAHWDGTAWTRVVSPNPGSSDNYLGAVTNAGPDDVWAAGFYFDYSTGRFATLTLRWNGTAWVVVPSPNPSLKIGGTAASDSGKPPRTSQPAPDGSGYYPPSSPGGNMLLGIAAAAPNEIWAVGSSDQQGDSETNTLILRWNGSQWTVVPSANPSGLGGYNRLYAVDVAGRDDAWATGTYWNGANSYVSLTERYDGNNCPTPTPVAPTATPTPCSGNPAWAVLPSANGNSVNNQLETVGVVSPNDIWALGSHYYGLSGGLMEHWDGTSWTLVPNAIRTSGFEDIAVIAANDIWAVGNGGGNPDGAVTAHWDGTSWTRIGLAEYGPEDSLYGVAAVAANNVWAVGYNADGVLILHWDGIRWSRTGFDQAVNRPAGNGPAVPTDYLTRLTDVKVVSAGNIWAVGTIRVSGSNHSLIMHYDGTSWNFVSSPNPGAYANVLESLSVVGPNDIWAVGYSASSYESASQSLALHYNGTTWTQVTTPSPGLAAGAKAAATSEYVGTFLYDVDAVAANEVWAVGKYVAGDSRFSIPVILRWDGSQWSRIASPSLGGYNVLFGVEAIAPNYVWAVGTSGSYDNLATLTMRFGPPCNATPFPTNTAVATNTPRPATATPVPPTNPPGTPTLTQTPAPTSTPAPPVTATATPTCGPSWQRVSSLDPAGNYNQLSGVAVVAPNDVWAVGEYRANGSQVPYIEHWNGTAWSLVPAPATGYSGWTAIAAVAANDIWAVGYDNASGFFQPFTAHWNGTVWSAISTPHPLPGAHGSLKGVGAVSANDVWAVGDSPTGPLTMHWDGTQWTVVPSLLLANTYRPSTGNAPGSYDNSLFAVGGVASNDVWAVGTRNGLTWALHWNGAQWSQVSTPNPGTANSLNAITVIASNDIWAVGHRGFYQSPIGAIALHWNGSTWTVVPTPAGNFGLFGVTATAANAVWAVGIDHQGQYTNDALILGWNGAQWTRVPSPNPTYASRDELFAVAASASGEVWAVGMFDFATLIDRYYSQPCGTPEPTPTVLATHTVVPPSGTASVPTPTMGPPSSTVPVPTPTTVATTPTATPSAIAAACSMQFSDVTATNTFYQPTMCLSCMGFMSGYSDGTFRPQNPVTRGQLAKVTANAAGFSDTPTQQTFADVAVGSTFYVYIERLAARAVLGGYRCGGAAEPCDAANRPYFRPNANVTRGQIAKIVSNAAGLTDAPTGQTFDDVAPDHPFYVWVQRLAQHDVMSGYLCGSAGEPCGLTGKPYFRPNNSATRGQLSKIVGNGLYPSCAVR